MYTNAITEAHIGARVQLIDVPAARSDQVDRKSSHGVWRNPPIGHRQHAAAVINP
jgi:hypothetical protein